MNINRLFEHYQGKLNSGVFHFKAATCEGAVFFDNTIILDGIYAAKKEKITGSEAVDRLTRECAENKLEQLLASLMQKLKPT